MPLFDYECNKCGHAEEKLEPMSAPTVQTCPKCNAENAFIRVLKACTAFVLSGGGWFKEGYSKGK